MCDTYVPGVGYICESCQDDFKDHVVNGRIQISDDESIREALIAFLDTKKETEDLQPDLLVKVDDFFKEHTPYFA